MKHVNGWLDRRAKFYPCKFNHHVSTSINFAFSCQENLFTPDEECSKYTGPFCFYWYDKNHVCRLTRIGKRGKILAEH